VSFYDVEGHRLLIRRMARMPEERKATLKTMLSEEIAVALRQRPDLTLLKFADAAKDNWTYLGAASPPGVEIIDYYHVCDRLEDASDAAHGEKSKYGKAQFEKYRYILRYETDGG
jgi:hypothetical protein